MDSSEMKVNEQLRTLRADVVQSRCGREPDPIYIYVDSQLERGM